MNTNNIDFRNKVGRFRQAYSKSACYHQHELLEQYKLDEEFLKHMVKVGLLLPESDTHYWKSAAWLFEPSMSPTRLLNIAMGKTQLSAASPSPSLSSVSANERDELLDRPINTPFLGEIIKSRKSLTMGFKFTKGKQLSAELSWYSSQAFETIEANNPEARRRFYEQEAFEVDGQIYRVVDLEAHLLKAVKEFFDGTSVETTIKRIHYT